MNKLAKREKILIAIGAIGIIAYLYFTLFLGPSLAQITTENNSIEAKTNQYNEILKLKAINISNQKKLMDEKVKYEGAIKQLPANLRDPEITNDLNNMASTNKVTISSISFGNDTAYVASANKPGTSTSTASNSTAAASTSSTAATQKSTVGNEQLNLVTVNLAVTGDGNAVISFIRNIETNKRIAEVENANLASKTDTTKRANNSVQANVTISYYYNYDPSSKETINYDGIAKGNTGSSGLFN